MQYGNSHLWHQTYSLSCTNVLGFIARRVKSKIIGIGVDDHFWGYVKTIKSGKRSAISSYLSDKHIIVYTSACIKSDIILRTHSESNINDCHPRHA